MKRFLAIALALVLALSLCACGSSGKTTSSGSAPASSSKAASSSSAAASSSKASSASSASSAASGAAKKMTLILRGGTYSDVLKLALPQFEKDNNVTCEVLDLSFDDLHSKISLDAKNAKGAYDLCMVDGSWMAEFTANKVLTNLSQMGYKFDDDIIPETTTICKVGNDIYLAPYFGNVTVMLYNKQLLKDAGYTVDKLTSWEDVMKVAKSANSAGKKGFLVRGGSPDNIVSDFIPHILAQGGWVVDSNNKPTVNTPQVKAALEEYMSLYKLGDTMDKDDIVAAVQNGNAAMAVGWPGWYKQNDNSSYTVIPTKLTASDTAKKTSMYGTWTIGICNNSQNKELALKLLEYVMSAKVQLATIDKGGVPCRKSCLTNADVLKKYPTLQIVYNALTSGVYRPVIEQWNDFTTDFGTEVDNVLKGTKTVDKGLADAQSQLEMLLG